LARKPEEKGPIGEDDIIKIDIKEIGWKGENQIVLSHDSDRYLGSSGSIIVGYFMNCQLAKKDTTSWV
jgi:hypothetical protein